MSLSALTRPMPIPPDPAAELRRRVDELTTLFVARWRATPAEAPELGPPIGWRRKRAARNQAKRLIDRLAAEGERCPEDEESQRLWRRDVRRRIQGFGEEHLGWPAGYRRLLFADGFFESTVDFVRQARAFDPAMRPEDLEQALRNVWIANSLQMLLGLPLGLTRPAFAYSMLYPLTDNVLDDPALAPADKRRFNRRLGRRLTGERPEPRDGHEERLDELVGRVEGHYSRSRYPEVFESLLAIHRAQIGSLAQQRAAGASDDTSDEVTLLALSVEKGGTSVLADGYLAAGRLSPAEEQFCFGYGVFLQLLDDLQDVRADRRAGHRTLFSIAAGERPLDLLTGRLLRFMEATLDGSTRFAHPRYHDLKDLIRRNCTFLLMGAVGDAPELFTRPFRRRLERPWPFTFAAMRRLTRRARQRYERAAERLRQRRGVDSPLDLLDADWVSGRRSGELAR